MQGTVQLDVADLTLHMRQFVFVRMHRQQHERMLDLHRYVHRQQHWLVLALLRDLHGKLFDYVFDHLYRRVQGLHGRLYGRVLQQLPGHRVLFRLHGFLHGRMLNLLHEFILLTVGRNGLARLFPVPGIR